MLSNSYELQEVCDFIDYRGKTPPKKTFGIPLITAKIVKNGSILPPQEFIAEDFYEEWMRRGIPQKGDILFTTEAPLGEVAQIKTDAKLAFAQRIIILQPKPDVLNSSYLLYALQDRVLKGRIEAKASGTTVVGIKSSELKKVIIDVPPLTNQLRIGTLLGTIDDKITLNHQINQNLQEQCKTLCNAWLNDYIPFGGNCPDGWELTPLSSFARFISGYSYKGSELQPSSVAMATIKNFDRKGGFKLDGYKEIVPSDKLKPEHHASLYDTLVAHTDLTQNAEVIGNAEPVLSFSGYEDVVFSMDIVKVVPNNFGVSKFLIAAMLQTQQFKGHCLGYVNGTTVLHLSKNALPEYSLMLPKDFSILKPLDEAVSAMYQQMALNIDECVKLTKLRDALLPQLMTGELDLSEIEY